MNLIKKLGVFAFLGSALLSLGACTERGTNDITEPKNEINAAESKDEFDYSSATMTSISIVESTAKTKFYLGDEFSSEGLTANANFVSYVNGSPVSHSFQTQDLTVNYSDVDFYNVGIPALILHMGL